MSANKARFAQQITLGSYPEPLTLTNKRRQFMWFSEYIDTTITRDISSLSDMQTVKQLSKLLLLTAAQVGKTINYSQISRSLEITEKSVKSYLSQLEGLFLLKHISAWS